MAGPLPDPQHEKFAQELAKGSSASAAYAAAGYSPHRQNASRLMANDDVQARVAEIQARGAARAEVTVEMVLRELKKIGFSDIRKAVRWRSNLLSSRTDEETGEIEDFFTTNVDLVDSEEIDDDTAAAIGEISQTDKGGLKVKFHDKRAALVDIGRHLGMFKDRTVLENPDGSPIASSITVEFVQPAKSDD